MSVRIYDPAEIATLFNRYEAFRAGTTDPFAPAGADVRGALLVLSFANLMAACLTYPDWNLIRPPFLEDVIDALDEPAGNPAQPDDLCELVRSLRLALYNTVSNDGVNCLPEPYRETLRRAADCILENLAGFE